MPSWPHPLHPALTPYVERCVGYDYRLDPDAVHYGLPSTSIAVVIAFEEPLDCGWLGSGDSDQFWRLASGLHDEPALIRTHGRQLGIQLALTPLGTRRLLGLPAGAITGGMVGHDDLPFGVSAEVHGRLAALGWDDRFALLEAHLLDVLSRGDGGRSGMVRDFEGNLWSIDSYAGE